MKVTITAGRTGHHSRIEVDGVDISAFTRGITLSMNPGDVTKLTLELLPEVVVVDGDIDPEQVSGLKEVVFHRKRVEP